MPEYHRLARKTVVLFLATGSVLALAQDLNSPSTAQGAVLPSANEADCSGGFSDAQLALERALQLSALKRWQDALPNLRDASAGLTRTAASCPELAVQANVLAEKAARESRVAESIVSYQINCQPRLEKALELDIVASTARREKRDPHELENLLAVAEAGWRDAANQCQSPYRETAERNLSATLRARSANAEQLSGGPVCDNAWKNANTLGDLAKGAWKERQWEEASTLYHKALFAWEGVKDKCPGSRQQFAEKKFEQTQLDAHNAEHCGPQWDEATELSMRMKAEAASAGVAERESHSIRAEVAWRDAVTLCRGAPQSLARNNADALARERGAPLPPQAIAQYGKRLASAQTPPLVATLLPEKTADEGIQAPLRTAPDAQVVVAAAAPALVKSAAAAARSAPAANKTVEPKALPAAEAAPQSDAPAANKPAEAKVIVSGETTFRGDFVRNSSDGTLSGVGSVEWMNGDRYSGHLVNGQRNGKGRFDWPSGQWYEGDWVKNVAVGQGMIHFDDGNVYEGSVSDGKAHGRGTMIFVSGDRYFGDFVQGSFHGQGTYFWKSGTRYDGFWVLGKKHGKGRLTMENGSGWEGEFRDDQETADVVRFTAASKTVQASR